MSFNYFKEYVELMVGTSYEKYRSYIIENFSSEAFENHLEELTDLYHHNFYNLSLSKKDFDGILISISNFKRGLK